MCGISGLISLKDFDVSPYIYKMTDIIKHRGPDGEGYYISDGSSKSYFLKGQDTPKFSRTETLEFLPKKDIAKNKLKAKIALGHRRLAIVDLSPHGHQPMSIANQDFVISYNGEIYNHKTIRKNLERKGHKFYSNSDTEVLLKAYQEWGHKCLNKLNGMFAFIIYDCKSKRIFVARDRFGIKPLYYYMTKDYLAIASEIKQFTTLPNWKAKLNKKQAYDFLAFAKADHTNETMFEDVYQIRGGEFFEIDIQKFSKIRPKRWYKFKIKKTNICFEEATEKFKELFLDAVNLRLKADVEVGTALSGGLDSSSIVCTANKFLRQDKRQSAQNSFSACSEVEEFDERYFIDIVKDHTDIKSHYTYPEHKDLLQQLDKIIWHHDEPFCGTSVYAEWSVYKLVHNTNVKVTLDGHGADELLLGYHSFIPQYLYDLLLKGEIFNFLKECYHLRKFNFSLSKIILRSLYNAMPAVTQRFCRKIYKGNTENFASWLNLNYEDLDATKKSAANIEEVSKQQIFNSSIPVQLHWADRDSMAYSIESRVPFLDYRLVEFAYNLPTKYKLNSGWTKRILRESMIGTLPEKIRNRKCKLGFATPESVWIQNHAPEVFKQEVRLAVQNSKGVIKEDFISLADEIIDAKKTYNSVVWRVLAFSKWLQVYNVEV